MDVLERIRVEHDQVGQLARLERPQVLLEPDGVLVLGAAESVVGISDAFKADSERRGLYYPNAARTARAGVTAMSLLKAVAVAAR